MMFTVRILFDNVSSLWQSPLHGNRPIVNNIRNGLYHQFVKLSIKKYKKCLEAANFLFLSYFSTKHTKSSQFHSNTSSFFTHFAIYNSNFRLGNFVKLTFDSSCLNSEHVLFGCRNNPQYAYLPYPEKIFRFCRQIGDVGLGDARLGDVELGDVGLETWDSGTWTRGLRDVINKQHLIFALNLQSTFFGGLSRQLSYAGELISRSRWFSASMVRPDMFACLFDRENSGYRVVSTQGVLKLLKTSWAAMEDFPGK